MHAVQLGMTLSLEAMHDNLYNCTCYRGALCIAHWAGSFLRMPATNCYSQGPDGLRARGFVEIP